MQILRPDELRVGDAAALLGVDARTVRRWCRAGLVANRYDGRHWFPKLAAVTALARHRARIARLVSTR